MRLPPPEVVASWPEPNYANPVGRGPTLQIVEIITLCIAMICLGLRIYVKLKILKKSELDDWLMVAGTFFGAALTVCVVLAFTCYGWDLHVWDLDPSKLVASRQVSFAGQGLFLLSTSLAKMSILISYLRLAPQGSWFRRLTYAAMWYVVLVNIAFLVALFAQCTPLSSYWHLDHYDRDCSSEAPTILAQAITTAVADFVVWMLPLPSLYRARLPRAQRLALLLLFSFGAIVVFAACIRAYWIHYVVYETYDVTWHGFHLWMWTAVETHLGIICGCVPWLKSLFTFWRSTRQSVTEVTDKSDPSRRSRPRSDAPQKRRTLSKDGTSTLIRMDSISEGSSGEVDRGKDMNHRERDEWVDLESCMAGNEDIAAPGLSKSTPGLAL